MGKVLCLFGEPQWAVVGAAFPVGCRFSSKVVYPEFFALNPDSLEARYNTVCGVYGLGCGLANVHLSWGQPVLAERKPYYEDLMVNYLPGRLQF